MNEIEQSKNVNREQRTGKEIEDINQMKDQIISCVFISIRLKVTSSIWCDMSTYSSSS